MTSVVVAALFCFAGDVRTASAECGDYVLVNGVVQHVPHAAVAAESAGEMPRKPCTGPSCRGTPLPPPLSVALTFSATDQTVVAAILDQASFEPVIHQQLRSQLGDEAAFSFAPLIWRPPQ